MEGACVQAAFAARFGVLVLAESRTTRAVEHALAVEDQVHNGAPSSMGRPATPAELRRPQSRVVQVYRDLVLAEAVDAAGRFAPDRRPRLLDRPAGTSLFRSSEDQDLLGPAVSEAFTGVGVADAQEIHAAARSRTLTGRIASYPAADSAWVRDPDRLYLGR